MNPDPRRLAALLTVVTAAHRARTPMEAFSAALPALCACSGWVAGRVWLLSELTAGESWTLLYNHSPDSARLRMPAAATEAFTTALKELQPGWYFGAGIAAYAHPLLIDNHARAVLEFFSLTAQPPDAAGAALLAEAGAHLAEFLNRHHEQKVIERSASYLHHLTENVMEFITVLNPDGTIRYESPYVEKILGFRKEDYLGRSVFDFVHPEDLPQVAQAFGECLVRPGHTPVLTFRFRHQDGSWRWLEGFGNNLLHLPAVAGIIFNSRDVTEHTVAEAALRESEQRFRSVTNSASDAIIAADNDGFIIFWNHAAHAIFGYTEAEILGRPLTILMPERYRDAHNRGIARYRHTGKSKVIGNTTELEGLRKGGSEFPLELTLGTWESAGRMHFTGVIRDITERQTLHTLTHRAYHDTLTSLPNRALFMDRLEHAMALGRRHHHQLAVLFIDLDNFKQVNDQYGHAMGDRLLVELSQRMRADMRPGDTLARLGGDEFVVLLENISNRDDTTRVSERVIEHIQTLKTLEGRPINVSASIGIALNRGDEPAEELLRAADEAMYMAKRAGKSRYHVHSEAPTAAGRKKKTRGRRRAG
jgi:diguanylate cyclase (GGDEF)-like protein/PAS domain S-box-containing protein